MAQDYSFILASSPREIDAAYELQNWVLDGGFLALEKLLLQCDICPGLVLLRPQTSDFLFGI
jgi:hypothetical protein